jgi:hypothetical protein
MQLVDTETPNPDRFARTADGKIDFDAYKGLNATYRTGELDFEVTILDSRQRFGHLDLLITPAHGAGERWTEFKNLTIHNDPAQMAAAIAVANARAAASRTAAAQPSPEIEAEPEEITVLTVVEESVAPASVEAMLAPVSPSPLPAAMDMSDPSVQQMLDDDRAEALARIRATKEAEIPAMPDPGPHGTHWTEVAPQPVVVATQEVEAPASTDIEDEVAAILGDNSPHVK